MSVKSFIVEEEPEAEVVFVAEVESSEDPPVDEWPSLVIPVPKVNMKHTSYQKGVYAPESGDVCAKYIAMSDSDILKHPYCNYPAVEDPGIENALFDPEQPMEFSETGQDLYLAICKEMGEPPIKSFVRGLLDDVINLSYYCVRSTGVRSIALALAYNRHVKVLNLSGSFLNTDACLHLGEMLSCNTTIIELNLSGCRIGPFGAKRLFAGLSTNRSLQILNLNRNELNDEGVMHFANAVFQGIDVEKICLNYNNISGNGVAALAVALETYNNIVHIDLSWNRLHSTPNGTFNLLAHLGENKVLQHLNLSWNSLSGQKFGMAIRKILSAPNLRHLDLSNNKIKGDAISNFLGGLTAAKNLVTLNLSRNPLTPEDALFLLEKVKNNNVKVQNVVMDDVFVDAHFVERLAEIKQSKSKENVTFTYGAVKSKYEAIGPDMREILLNRADYLGKKPKKQPVDVALIVMQLLKDNNEILNIKEFSMALKRAGAHLDEDLVEGIANVFAGPWHPKHKTIDVKLLVDYIKRKWPDRKLPPTPPPEPEPEPIPVPEKKGKRKGKSKRK